MQGLVVKSTGGLFTVRPLDEAEGKALVACRARGDLRRGAARILVGDRVVLVQEAGDYVIEQVLPRRNALIRPPLANLDEVLVAVAVADPAPILETTDKLLSILEYNQIGATIVLTKADLSPAAAGHLQQIYQTAGYRTQIVSAYTGDGVAELAALLAAHGQEGRCFALAGASGVGKSSLMNALFPALQLQTGEISRKLGRGRNTTRHTELHEVWPGAFLADTPGFSLLDFSRFDFLPLAALPATFREFAPYLGACRYGDCRHIKEEDCAIRRALAAGRIAPSRYESYVSLWHTLKEKDPYAPRP